MSCPDVPDASENDVVGQIKYGSAVILRAFRVRPIECREFNITARHRLDPGRYSVSLISLEPGQSCSKRVAAVVGGRGEAQHRLAANDGVAADGLHVERAQYLPAESRRDGLG